MSNIDEQIKLAELEKIKAETKKLEAECIKNGAELKVINRSFFKSDRFIQALITAVIGIPVVVAFFNFFLAPANEQKVNEEKAKVTEQMAAAAEQKLLNVRQDSVNNESIKKLDFQERILKQRESEISEQKDSNRILLSSIKKEQLSLARTKQQLSKTKSSLIKERHRTVLILDEQITKFQADPGKRKILLQVVYFEYDSRVLKKASQNKLNGIIDFLKEFPTLKIMLKGYSYSESGPMAYTLALSKDRANTVKMHMVNSGIPAAAIKIQAYGETPTEDLILNQLDKNIDKKLYEIKSSVAVIGSF